MGTMQFHFAQLLNIAADFAGWNKKGIPDSAGMPFLFNSCV
jgi:hypothetical protein